MLYNTIVSNGHMITYVSNDMLFLLRLDIANAGHICMKGNIHICILVWCDIIYVLHTIQCIIYVIIVTICYIYFEVDK